MMKKKETPSPLDEATGAEIEDLEFDNCLLT